MKFEIFSSVSQDTTDPRANHNISVRINMNAVLLSGIFVLGVLSAVFITIWTIEFKFARKLLFQPVPYIDQLQIGDEHDFVSDPENAFDGDPTGGCDGENLLALELEAVTSIHAALEMKEQGKLVKAKKLFQHAIALCPRHADVLTNFGEFFENAQKDVIMADHLYVQALSYSPQHSKALINRLRTLPVVEEIDERRLQRIDEKHDVLMQIPESSPALRRMKKEAYFQHLYHTAGIEGNTMTLSQTRSIVETGMAIGGKSILEHNEILGLDAAMKFINSSLLNRIGSIAIRDILNIHRHVMSYADPSEAGKFRRNQVYVGSHIPPPPDKLEDQVKQLTDWLNSEEALALHPTHYAAIAHYKLVYIHPFLDGNGRTSRLLMNWILMSYGYPPVIIRKQDRSIYYEHLNTANKGDVRPFIRFIADCTERTIDVYIWATQEMANLNNMLGPEEPEDDKIIYKQGNINSSGNDNGNSNSS